MSALNIYSVVKVMPGPLAERLDEEIAIFDPDSGLYFGLNEVGGRIWELLQDPKSLEEVAARLVEEYDVPLARCQADVHALTKRLLDAKLVELVH